MRKIETGLFLGRIPFAKLGPGPDYLLILNGGQGFMRQDDRYRRQKDMSRIAGILPPATSLILIGYDPDPRPEITLDDMADDIANIIGLNFTTPVSLMGISYGGVIAARTAARHPAMVGRLVLLASAHDFSAEGKRRIGRQIRLAESGQLSDLLAEFTTIFRRPWLNLLLRLRLKLGARKMIDMMGQPAVIVRYLGAMLGSDTTELRNISAETLILGGERDQFFGDGMMEATANAIPASRLVLLPDETHAAPIERAADVRQQLEGFLLPPR